MRSSNIASAHFIYPNSRRDGCYSPNPRKTEDQTQESRGNVTVWPRFVETLLHCNCSSSVSAPRTAACERASISASMSMMTFLSLVTTIQSKTFGLQIREPVIHHLGELRTLVDAEGARTARAATPCLACCSGADRATPRRRPSRRSGTPSASGWDRSCREGRPSLARWRSSSSPEPSRRRLLRWSGRRESNPRLLLGRQGHYHYATPATGIGQGWIRTSVALSRAKFTAWCH